MENNDKIIELDQNNIENLDMEVEQNKQTILNEFETLNNKLKISKRKNLILSVFLALVVVILISFCTVSFIVYKNIKPHFRALFGKNFSIASISQISDKNKMDLEKFTTKLAFLDDIINILYYYDKDNKKIEDAMFTGYINALGDNYAEYYPPKEFEEFTEKMTEGVYYGIGCLVNQDRKTKDCKVTDVYENSPAEKGGVKIGDIFVSVDGINVRGDELETIIEKIRGKEGTKRELVVYRESEKQNINLTVYCGKVDIKLVSDKILEDNIGYIELSEFTGKSTRQFKNSVNKLLNQNIKGLIIDLRGNPGGELITVCEMMDYLIKDRDGRYTLNQKDQIFEPGKTLLVYIKEKGKIVDAAYADDNHSVELPIVILTNYSTASAAELFTETLRDYKKATVVGVKTFGKGVVQNMIPYDDGSAFKFTVSEYLPPSGYSIDLKGIIPDYSLDVAGIEVNYNKDNNIVVYEDDKEIIFDRNGSIIAENDIVISTESEIDNSNKISKSHVENLKIYDEENSFLDEDWFISLDDKYDDKQLLQAIVVMKDKIN